MKFQSSSPSSPVHQVVILDGYLRVGEDPWSVGRSRVRLNGRRACRCPARSLPCPQNRQAHLADVSARCSVNTKRANPRRNTTTQRSSRSSCSNALRCARVVQVCNPIGQDLSPRDSSKMFLGTILRLLSNVKHVNKYCKSGTGNWKLEVEIVPCRSCTSWDGSEPQL